MSRDYLSSPQNLAVFGQGQKPLLAERFLRRPDLLER
jgi:hypothetical protein